VQKHIAGGLPIRYIRNQENIGPDRNFVQCFHAARGKYLWLLGDVDYLKEDALAKIIDVLKTGTYGLVHLQIKSKEDRFLTEYNDTEKFLLDISYWITFISSNIVSAKYIKEVEFERYFGSFFIQVPLYITAALSEPQNAIIHERVFEDGADYQRNGNYNLFDVFVNKYLSIWKEFVKQGKISHRFYEKQKYRIFKEFLVIYIFKLLIKKDKGNFKTKGSWKILFATYGYYLYFYWDIFLFPVKLVLNKLKI
jgi:hypothetical protein